VYGKQPLNAGALAQFTADELLLMLASTVLLQSNFSRRLFARRFENQI